MAIYGIDAYAQAAYGGAGTISVAAIVAIGTHTLQVVLTAVPRARDPLGLRDALNWEKWAIEPIDPRFISEGQVVTPPGKAIPVAPDPWISRVEVDPDDATQLILFTTHAFQEGVDYLVSLVGTIVGAGCEQLTGQTVFEVAPVIAANEPDPRFAVADRYRDFANPYFVQDKATGQTVEGPGFWTFDESTDVVLDSALESLRKRVLRRILTRLGSFSHAPKVGFDMPVKRRISQGIANELAARLSEGLQREPDVALAAVVARIDPGGLLRLDVSITRYGAQAVQFLYRVPVQQ